MTHYWFEFKGSFQELSPGLILGCGVTAYDYADAISILKRQVFKGKDLPEIKTKVENIDIRTLDNGHIRPNHGRPDIEGCLVSLGIRL